MLKIYKPAYVDDIVEKAKALNFTMSSVMDMGQMLRVLASAKRNGRFLELGTGAGLVWAFNIQEDWDFVQNTCDIFESEDWEVCIVELEAELESRVERNKTENRLLHKPTKRDIEYSEQELRSSMCYC